MLQWRPVFFGHQCALREAILQPSFDSIELAIFSGRLNAICEEMGFTLRRSALSPNIKDRLDFSCALFDSSGGICAQAAHIPVHLGSMAFAMNQVVSKIDWQDGDVVVFNDPFLGGTHLPDVTMVSPVFVAGELLAFVANRAHHANIGASAAGSMPLSDDPAAEGMLISPQKLFQQGVANQDLIESLASLEHGEHRDLPGDFLAQLSANRIGCNALSSWLAQQGCDYFLAGLAELNSYGRRLTLDALAGFPAGEVELRDYMDDDGFGQQDIAINLHLALGPQGIVADFSGSAEQVRGNINCPLSVTVASVYYAIVCLLPDYVPSCEGVFACIDVRAPKGCFLNAKPGVAVAAGNVETSMRIADVVISALAKLGLAMPADSHGSMNNVAMGAARGTNSWDCSWNYYETIGGGGGASAAQAGLSASQVHMTNSLNTPIESLELHYPLRIERYQVRRSSGGEGLNKGGDGLIRSYRFLEPASLTLLTEHRRHAAKGVDGAGDGALGRNDLNGEPLAGKCQLVVAAGDVLTLQTPGGGGFGSQAPE